ncbi:zinc-ribbon and DUF3426 domain-containing protein [Dyella kyungheensis]|jgi:predicted Zn finger-like uncharacterized protein|uniref:DUF3426 domain-containing protein n=1 Tax=Dyella kyungheensis TaxID=1242174 RepID=A0ABS2JTV0_9GAMM|nr:zinc-ribbon and DUF3426 domain-containing protein [Dyella kyungheensis]MBM7122255.1 DUF3426 domain-containing protein [Dyella kyungheensis]
MYAQCPECLTVFSINVEVLVRAGGKAICGHCDNAFDTLYSLHEHLPAEPFDRLPIHQQGLAPRIDLAIYRPPAEPPAVAEAPAPPDVLDEFANLVVAPRFARKAEKKRRWPWITACTVLLLALGAQLAWAERDAMIGDDTVGPLLRDACNALGCQLPLVQDIKRLSLVARDVQAHPSVPGALLITANLRNDAPFAQPYPVVSITLSDANGKKLAMRRLRPTEYLGDGATLRKGIPSDGSAALMLEVEDPSGKAVAFEFDFE